MIYDVIFDIYVIYDMSCLYVMYTLYSICIGIKQYIHRDKLQVISNIYKYLTSNILNNNEK